MNAKQWPIRLLILAVIFLTVSSFLNPPLSIKGDWISDKDSQNGIRITDNKWMEVYAGSPMYSGTYKRDTQPCDPAYAKKAGPKKMDFVKIEDGRCFEVVSVATNQLSLRYTKSGSVITFHREKPQRK